MSQGREILRRLLIAIGAAIASIGFCVGAWVAITDRIGSDVAGGVIGMMCAVGGFFGWRATINWVLLYEKPEKPQQPDAEF